MDHCLASNPLPNLSKYKFPVRQQRNRRRLPLWFHLRTKRPKTKKKNGPEERSKTKCRRNWLTYKFRQNPQLLPILFRLQTTRLNSIFRWSHQSASRLRLSSSRDKLGRAHCHLFWDRPGLRQPQQARFHLPSKRWLANYCLARRFAPKFGKGHGRRLIRLTQQDIGFLRLLSWPLFSISICDA